MKRIAQLDGVRGVAILLVIIWHYFVCQVVAEPHSVISYCARALSLTWSGVDLFFVLSGFLIAGILLDHRDSPTFFRTFYLRRACRILPLYCLLVGTFACLTATPLFSWPSLAWLFRDPLPIWSYASFTQNLFMGARGDFGPHWLGITWSLAVEEQFYVVVPFLVCFLPRRMLVYALVVSILAAPLLRCASPGFHAFVNTPWRADSLLSGALLAVLVRWNPFVTAVQKYQGFISVLFVVLLAGAALMTIRPTSFGIFKHIWLAGFYSIFVLIAFNQSDSLFRRILSFAPLVWIGQLSYGIYMFHQAVSGLLHGSIRDDAPQIRSLYDAGVTLSSLCITLALAVISYRFIESPIIRLGHRFKYLPKVRQDAAFQPVLSEA